MPPHRQPTSLRSAALKIAAATVFDACVNIEKTYGNLDDEICQIKTENLQQYLLSKLRPLFEELFEAVLFPGVSVVETLPHSNDTDADKMCRLDDGRILFSMLLCERSKKLTTVGFRRERRFSKCLDDCRFWKNQIAKLSGIVVLDASGINLSDEIFVEISRTCTNLREIRLISDRDRSSKHAVMNLLACKELRVVGIVFLNWHRKDEVMKCIRTFVENLPKLRFFDHDEMATALSSEEVAVNSLRKINEMCVSHASLLRVVRACPHLRSLDMSARFNSSAENSRVLDTLAGSSLPLDALGLDRFAFDDAMARLLAMKGRRLRTLRLGFDAGDVTVDEVRAVGSHCPNLEELEIVEYYRIPSASWSQSRVSEIPARRRPFVRLRRLRLDANSEWDRRVLPTILRDARGLETVVLTNVFPHSVDPLGICGSNPLTKLESLVVVAERYGHEVSTATVSKEAAARLVDHCSALKTLTITSRFEEETLLYFQELRNKVKQQNMELDIKLNEIKYAANNWNMRNVHDGYILYDE